MNSTTSSGPREWTWRALAEVADAVVATDAEGRVTFMNPAAGRLAGLSPEEAKGRFFPEVLPLLDETTHQPAGLSGERATRHALLPGPGVERRIEARVEPLANGAGTAGTLVVLHDVTERERAEQALRESEERHRRLEEELRRRTEELAGEDRRKDQFLAMLAHELRNPLAPIRNAVELMRQVETFDPSFQPSREMVERQVKHLARLVDDLLDVSRITRGSIRLRKEPVDLGAIVQSAVEGARPLITTRSHELEVELPQEPLRLEADPARLEQIVANLLDNAARYTMPGGHIWVTARREGGEAVVRVRDSGIGVPPDVLERVFEPFVQTAGESLARTDGGLGVGLTLVRSLVEMHGGQVEARSPGLGQGSEFVVRLPARPPEGAEGPAAEPAVLPQARSLRVLVVEDNLDAAESLATLLRLWNHDVRVVNDGPSALDAAREQKPEVVLLDIGLPGLDGFQVARKLREEPGLEDTLLVAMTGYGQPEDRRRSREAGIHHHFVKPVEPLVLRNLLAGVAPPDGWDDGRVF
jgi:two-component system CheB/CheR fusion protein